MAEDQVHLAILAIKDNNIALAEQIIADDHKLDLMEASVNEQCIHILAQRQPIACDLRLVIAVIRALNDIERIGDDAKRIARITINMSNQYPEQVKLDLLLEFGEQVIRLLHDALDAFARMDAEAAMEIKQRDRLMDIFYGDILKMQMHDISVTPSIVPMAFNLIWIAKRFERIGDRICNICEHIMNYKLTQEKSSNINLTLQH